MPVLYPPNGDGDGYRTEVQTEVTRLIAAGYTETPERPPTVADLQLHPGDHDVERVLTEMAEKPAEIDRIIAEEKAGKRRVSIIGKTDEPAPAEPSDG